MPVTRRLLFRSAQPAPVTGDDDATLLDVVRGALRQRSVARGCANGMCGSCRVLLDGELVNACVVPWASVRDGARLEVYADVEREPAAREAVAAFTVARPTRCRLCVPALGITAVSLARRGCAKDAGAVEDALESATCMCTGRSSMRRALLSRR